MREEFLHFIWQFQLFTKLPLQLESGEEFQVIKPGFLNTDSGPDFLEAKIKIGQTLWAGSVEIHIKSSDWYHHKHEKDSAFYSVVLHVVWSMDKKVLDAHGREIPCLVVQKIIEPKLLDKYRGLRENLQDIACASPFRDIPDMHKLAMLDSALANRMNTKSQSVLNLLAQNKGDWEETAYQYLAQFYGFKLNNHAFLLLAQNLPWNILQKNKYQPLAIEAMLFGVAGFLEGGLDAHGVELKKHFSFFQKKYALPTLPFHIWKFMRTRPANFPTIRLGQFLSFLNQVENILDFIRHHENPLLALQEPVVAYWSTHYGFGKKLSNPIQKMGRASAQNILVNGFVPILVAWSTALGSDLEKDKARNILESLPAEKNRITSKWEKLGLQLRHMQDSQGAIEWYNSYCVPKKCLACGVGVKLLLGKQ